MSEHGLGSALRRHGSSMTVTATSSTTLRELALRAGALPLGLTTLDLMLGNSMQGLAEGRGTTADELSVSIAEVNLPGLVLADVRVRLTAGTIHITASVRGGAISLDAAGRPDGRPIRLRPLASRGDGMRLIGARGAASAGMRPTAVLTARDGRLVIGPVGALHSTVHAVVFDDPSLRISTLATDVAVDGSLQIALEGTYRPPAQSGEMTNSTTLPAGATARSATVTRPAA